MSFTKTRKINKRFSLLKFAFTVMAMTALSAFGFSGCMSSDDGGVALNTAYQTGNIIISGKFAVDSSLTAAPSLDTPVSVLRSALENPAPSYALIGRTAEIALKDVTKGSIIATTVTDTAGRFQFVGSFRGLILAIEIKSSANQIMLGKIPANLPDNSTVPVSRTNADIDEYFAIATNIAKNKGMAEGFTVSTVGPETLLDMVDKLKIAGALYMYQYPAVNLTKILTESSNPQSAVTVGVIQNVPVGAFNFFDVSASTPQKIGNAMKISVTARDSFGNAVTNYSGSGTLAITGASGTAVWFGTGVTGASNGSASYGAGSFVSGTAVFYLTNTAGDVNKTVTITDSATGKSKSVIVSWVNNAVDHFEIIVPLSAQTAGVPFKVTIFAKDVSGGTLTDFTSEVSLSNSTLRISPLVTGNFTAGAWQGNITVYKSASADHISASYGSVTGKSSNFEVISAEASGIALINPPSGTQAAGAAFGPIQLGVYDIFENLVKSDNRTQVVAERGSYGSSQLKGTLVKTAVNGIFTFSDLKYEKAENITIKFSSATNSIIMTETEQLVITPAGAAKLVISRTPPSTVTSGNIFETQPAINVYDAYSNIVTGGPLYVTAQTGSIGTAALSGNTIISAVNGVAEFTNLSYAKSENFTIKFTAGELSPVETPLIKSQAAEFDNFEIIPTHGSAAASNEIILQVRARDANNNYFSSYSKSGSLNISGATGNVTWSGTGVTNSGNGYGFYSADAFSNGTAFIKILNTAADANKVVTITDTATGKGGTTFVSWTVGKIDHFYIEALRNQVAGKPFAVTITAKDIFNNTITDFSAALSLTDDTATITPKTLSQFVNGVCSADITITKASPATVVLATSGLIQGASQTLIIAADAAVKIGISGQPFTGLVNATLTPALQVKLYDAYNNQVTNDNTTQIRASVGQSLTALKGTTLKTAVNGSVAFDDLSYQTAENIIIQISASGLQASDAAPISITAAAASKLMIIQQPDDTLKAGAAFSKNFKIAVCDSYSNIITGDNTTKISIEPVSASDSVIEGVTSRTVTNGIAEFSNLLYKKAENVSFVFKTTSGPGSTESDTYKVLPGTAYALYMLEAPSAQAGVGTAFSPAPRIAVHDAYANLVTTDNSTSIFVVTPDGDGSQLRPVSYSVKAENGVAAFTGLSYNKAGKLTLKFMAVPGLKSVESTLITVVSGSFDRFSITSNTPVPQTAGGKVILKVSALDKNDNLIEDFNSGGSLSITGTTGTITWSGTGVTPGAGPAAVYSGAAFSKGVALIELTNTSSDANATFTITDSATNISKTAAVAWTPAALDHFNIIPDGQQVAGNAVNLRITACDAYSNTITGYSGTGTFSLTGAAGTVAWSGTGVTGSAYGAAAFSQGVADISVKNTSADANLTMKITDSTSYKNGTALLTWTYGALDRFEISSIPLSLTAGADISLTITAKDINGNIVKNYAGTLSLTDTTATIAPATANSFNNGVSVTTVKITKAQAADKITVTDAAISKTKTSNDFNVVAGAFKKITVDSNLLPAQVTAGANFSVTINALDEFNNSVTANTQVIASIGSAGDSNYLKGETTKTMNGTSVTFSAVNYQKAEDFKIKFSASGVADVETRFITCKPAAASFIKVSAQPSTAATAGTAFAMQPTAALCDAYGNVLAGENTISIKVEADTGSTVKSLGGTSTKVLVNGIAAFTDLLYTTAEQIKIKFTVAGGSPALPAAYSNYVTVSAGSAAKLSWVANDQPDSPQYKDIAFSQIRVAVCDNYGNIILTDSNSKITASKSSGTGTLSGELEVTVEDGIGSFIDLKYDKIEDIKLKFTSGSFPSLETNTIAVN